MSDDRIAGRDLKRNEDPEQIAGAVGGAAGAGIGGAAGAAILGGPVGVIVAILAGAVGGWWTGKGVQGAIQDVDRADNRLRRAHEHAGATRPYEEACHGYRLGYLAGLNPEYADGDFDAAEEDLRTAWVKAHAGDEQPVGWDEIRADARTGFELARRED